jgi:predicted anti-sigma-YlaC factor YlaD
MKRDCSSIMKLLEKFLDQEVSDEERALVESHLQDCPLCQESLRSMERLGYLIKNPVEEAAVRENFPWVWEMIERGIQSEEKLHLWESLQNWLATTLFLKRKVLMPVAAVMIIVVLFTASLLFKKTPSYPAQSVVEYVESQNYNVMIYESGNTKVTVIWLFDGPEEESSTS